MLAYRSEIDGLRALAVLPVILFHAGFSLFKGGFVGVDVFFVISGYLITSLVVTELDRGAFSLKRFYARRARRILPALFFVLACCIPFAWMWMIPSQLDRFAYAVAAATVSLSNLFFMDEAGYFGLAVELKPLLHTWSLGVEEQYYAVMPLVTLLVWRYGLRFTVVFSVIVALASLALCIVLVRFYPDPAFFLPFTRVWELQAGALCALLLIRKPPQGNGLLGLIGVALILAAVFLLDKRLLYPSEYTLLPVAGTMLVIVYARAGTLAARLLSLPVLVGIGLISYSAYLWHQPLFAFARLRLIAEPGQELLLALSVAALALGYLTWRFVERPFRLPQSSQLTLSPKLFAVASMVAILLSGLGLYGHISGGFPGRLDGLPDVTLDADGEGGTVPHYCPAVDEISDPCRVYEASESAEPAMAPVAVFGDSHAGALMPAFWKIAQTRDVYGQMTPGCPPLLDAYVVAGLFDPGVCKAQADKQFDIVRRKGIAVVFLVARWTVFTHMYSAGISRGHFLSMTGSAFGNSIETSRRALAEAVRHTAERYRAAGVKVVFVDQVPQQIYDPAMTIEKLRLLSVSSHIDDAVVRTSVAIAEDEDMQVYPEAVLSGLDMDGVSYVSFDERFARDGRYLWAMDGKLLYRDDDHLSLAGARFLADDITAYLDALTASHVSAALEKH